MPGRHHNTWCCAHHFSFRSSGLRQRSSAASGRATYRTSAPRSPRSPQRSSKAPRPPHPPPLAALLRRRLRAQARACCFFLPSLTCACACAHATQLHNNSLRWLHLRFSWPQTLASPVEAPPLRATAPSSQPGALQPIASPAKTDRSTCLESRRHARMQRQSACSRCCRCGLVCTRCSSQVAQLPRALRKRHGRCILRDSGA